MTYNGDFSLNQFDLFHKDYCYPERLNYAWHVKLSEFYIENKLILDDEKNQKSKLCIHDLTKLLPKIIDRLYFLKFYFKMGDLDKDLRIQFLTRYNSDFCGVEAELHKLYCFYEKNPSTTKKHIVSLLSLHKKYYQIFDNVEFPLESIKTIKTEDLVKEYCIIIDDLDRRYSNTSYSNEEKRIIDIFIIFFSLKIHEEKISESEIIYFIGFLIGTKTKNLKLFGKIKNLLKKKTSKIQFRNFLLFVNEKKLLENLTTVTFFLTKIDDVMKNSGGYSVKTLNSYFYGNSHYFEEKESKKLKLELNGSVELNKKEIVEFLLR